MFEHELDSCKPDMVKRVGFTLVALGLLIMPVPASAQILADAPTSPPSVSNPPTADVVKNQTDGLNKVTDGPSESAQKVLLKPGEAISVGTNTEDLVSTYDIDLARRQASTYTDSPEAHFILAVALSRSSHVEEALQEVRRARRLAEAKGGATYFNKMIVTYEEMLKNFPQENQVRYELAWAYYMKAYLLARQNRPKNPTPATVQAMPAEVAQIASAMGVKAPTQMPHIQGALEYADPSQAGEVKKYYELALGKLDDLLARQPNDIWAKVYRAFLNTEYTGNLEPAMVTWKACQAEAPDNPASYFFLAEGYLKQGNLKECFANISQAIALRAIGK